MTERVTMTPLEASKYLRKYGITMSALHVRRGIEQGTFPFGDHVVIVQNEFTIYKKKLDEWLADRVANFRPSAIEPAS